MNTSNSFGTILSNIREGECLDEASKKMQELVAAVRETGKKGTFSITFNVKPSGRRGMLTITDDIQVKIPKAPKDESIFFATDENTLQRTDPNQTELKFKTVEGGKVDENQLKTVNG